MLDYISLDDAKLYLRIDHHEEDFLIQGFIEAALESCENHLQGDFETKYPDTDDLPKTIRQAALFMLGHFYSNRVSVSEMKMVEVPLSSQHLLNPHRDHPFA